jgi:hypothetical protein
LKPKSTHRQKPAIAGFFLVLSLLMARDRTTTEPAALLQRRFMPITGKD